MKKVLFLDRDGTLNVDHGYIASPERFELIPGTLEALGLFQRRGYEFIIVTNQSGIARGYYTVADMGRVHEHFFQLCAAADIRILDVFYCPHHVEGVHPELAKPCNCRKPGTGMFEQATSKYLIDIRQSYMIGDKMIDVLAGRAAGLNPVFVGPSPPEPLPERTLVFPRLFDFAEWFAERGP